MKRAVLQKSANWSPLTTRAAAGFRTVGPPSVVTLAAHGFDGEALRALGSVDPGETPTSAEQVVSVEGSPSGGTFTLGYRGQTTAAIPFDADTETVRRALEHLPEPPPIVDVEGLPGGPYTLHFGTEVAEPLLEASGSGLQPSGSVSVVTTQQGGEEYATKYWVQYLSQGAFEAAGGFAGPELKQTAAGSVASVDEAVFEGVDLPGLVAGETYRYRLVGSSDLPGNPVVDGPERVLSVPAAAGSPPPALSCPNEASRSGASAALPDCRGYEQLTPVFKEGAREPFRYGLATGGGVAVGEGAGEGRNVMLEDEVVNWGSGVESGQSPYFFSRAGDGSWGMSAAARQPETGVDRPFPELLSRDLSDFAFVTTYETSNGNESKDAEFKTGPAAGPYVTVATVPVSQQGHGWVGASEDFTKLFMQSGARTLAGHPTHTLSGEDLYEYAEGALRQVNVTGPVPGTTVGACGASIVRGDEENGTVSSSHAVSADGSRVFFEAVPGKNCGEAKHLYIRMNGESTVDIGPYVFRGANREGTEVLVEKVSGETGELFLYEPSVAKFTPLFSFKKQSEPVLHISEDFSTVYFTAKESLTPEAPYGYDLYRYAIGSRELSFIEEGQAEKIATASSSSDDQPGQRGRTAGVFPRGSRRRDSWW